MTLARMTLAAVTVTTMPDAEMPDPYPAREKRPIACIINSVRDRGRPSESASELHSPRLQSQKLHTAGAYVSHLTDLQILTFA
jgi:hypothetical protein